MTKILILSIIIFWTRDLVGHFILNLKVLNSFKFLQSSFADLKFVTYRSYNQKFTHKVLFKNNRIKMCEFIKIYAYAIEEQWLDYFDFLKII